MQDHSLANSLLHISFIESELIKIKYFTSHELFEMNYKC